MKKIELWQKNLYSIWFVQILSIMSFNLGMPFMVFYIQEMGVSDPSQIKLYAGLLSAGPAIALGIMGPVWGRLADKFGKKIMMVRAIAFGSIVMFGLGMSTQVWHLIFLRFSQGIFTGTVTAAAALVASTVPEHKLGYSLGFLASSTAIGSSVGPALGGVVAEWLGYRFSFLMGGALMLLNLFVVLIFVKDNESPQKLIHVEKQMKLSAFYKGNVPDTFLHIKELITNNSLNSKNRKTTIKSENNQNIELNNEHTDNSEISQNEAIQINQNADLDKNSIIDLKNRQKSTLYKEDKTVLAYASKPTSFIRTKWFVSAMIMLLVLRFATSIFGPYMPIFVQDKLQTLEGAAGTTGLVNAFISVMLALSGIFLGKLSDKYNRVKLLRIYTFVGLLIAIPLQFSGAICTLMLNYGLMMFFIGGIEPVLMGAITQQIHRDQRGTLFGMQTMIGSIGWGLSPMLGSYLSIQFSITAVLIAIPVIMLIEFILASTIGKNILPRLVPKHKETLI